MNFGKEQHIEIKNMRESGKSWEEIREKFSEGGISSEALRKRHERYKRRFGADMLGYMEGKGINPQNVDQAWDKSKEYSIHMKYGRTPTANDLIDVFKDTLKQNFDYITPIKRDIVPRGDLLVVDPADVHIGKLATFEGGEYNIDIALERAREGIEGVVRKAEGFVVKQVLLVIGNDILHIDNPRRTTTAGTPQDTDGMWWDMFNAGIILYREAIKWLSEIAPVHVVYCPSNHDNVMGYCLSQCIEAYFGEYKNITFDTSMEHRKYFSWGKTLLGFSHGDGAKQADMPILMAQEAPQMWAQTEYRYWMLHHTHHYSKTKGLEGKDFVGVTIRYLRSPTNPDRWHKDNGYCGGKSAVEGFVYSSEFGQEAELTHNF